MGPHKPALVVKRDPPVKGDGDPGAVFTHHLKIYIAHLPGALEAGKALRKPLKVIRREKVAEPAADHLLPGVSQDVQPGLVDLPDNAVFVQGLVAQRGFFKQQAELFFAAAQVILSFSAPGDVGDGDAILDNLAPGLDHRQTLQGYRAGGALLGIDLQFRGLGGAAGWQVPEVGMEGLAVSGGDKQDERLLE